MKVFICADMEGATGIVHRDQLMPEGGAAYTAGCKLLTGDVVAVAKGALAAGASLIPLTLGMDAMRQVLFRTAGLMDVWTELGVLGALAVVFFFAARWSLRRLERRAREEGKLTVRWQ